MAVYDIQMTILNGQHLSNVIYVGNPALDNLLDNYTIMGFRFPSTWTTPGAVNFLEADNNLASAVFQPMCDTDGNVLQIANPVPVSPFTSVGKTIKDPNYPATFYGIKFLQLYAVNTQTGDQQIAVIVRDV